MSILLTWITFRSLFLFYGQESLCVHSAALSFGIVRLCHFYHTGLCCRYILVKGKSDMSRSFRGSDECRPVYWASHCWSHFHKECSLCHVSSKELDLWLSFFGVACDCFGFIYAVLFLPESVESVVEKRRLLRTFTMVKQANRRCYKLSHWCIGGLDESLLSVADKGWVGREGWWLEVDEIQTKFFASLRMERTNGEQTKCVEKEKMKNAHLTINYLIVIAIICEFCNKFIFSIFDTIVCQFGSVKHQLTSLQFRLFSETNLISSLLSAVGSALNIIQTGFLFRWLINDRGISIPTVGSFAGIVGGSIENHS